MFKRDPQFNRIVKVLKKEFKPKRLFLFGSRAQGNHQTDSDFDFVIVVNKAPRSRVDYMMIASKVLAPLNSRADVFVYSQKEFDEWKDELNSIPETALNTGIEIKLG